VIIDIECESISQFLDRFGSLPAARGTRLIDLSSEANPQINILDIGQAFPLRSDRSLAYETTRRPFPTNPKS
jgi:hypothetical protein